MSLHAVSRDANLSSTGQIRRPKHSILYSQPFSNHSGFPDKRLGPHHSITMLASPALTLPPPTSVPGARSASTWSPK